MMEPVCRIDGTNADPVHGQIKFDIPKLSWNLSMIALTVVFAPLTFSFSSLILFMVLTYLSLLVGHSVGMHRMMIHRTFDCPGPVEKLLIYIGVLVGMSGPFGILRIHDSRDWAQRQKACHDFFAHRRHFLLDIWWQLTCKFELQYPPTFIIEDKYAADPFYQWLEKTWRLHQIPLALVLYLAGGLPFVVWGVFVRIAVSVVGHWTITYFCHNPGPGRWRVKDASVQASNMRGMGLVTYGECWHNNHHAFPESAKIGLEPGQSDPAWWFIKMLGVLGLARNISLPREECLRDDLQRIASEHQHQHR